MYKVFDPYMFGLKGEPAEYLPYIKQYNMDGIGVDPRLFDEPEKGIKAAKLVREYGMSWGIMVPPVDFFGEDVDEQAFSKGLELFKKQADTAEKMNIQYCFSNIWPSCSCREYDENFEWHVGRLLKVQSVCSDHGINYGLECLGPKHLLYKNRHRFIHTTAGIINLSNAAGGKAGFVFDTFHWFCNGAEYDELYFAMLNSDRMFGFHVNDGIPGRPFSFQMDLERAMPMTTGVIDAAAPYKLFERAEYAGPVLCEPIQPTADIFKTYTSERCVREVSEAFSRLEA